MQYLLKEIAAAVGGTLIGEGDTPISELLTDSRSLIYPEESLFFALKSKQNDGLKYVKELYDRGVRSFVVTSLPDEVSSFVGGRFVLVSDTLVALQALAVHHRNSFTIPVIGITGSNGKTIVKEWLYQLMQDRRRISRSPRSYNSQIGVPLSIWKVDSRTELAIIEAGISQTEEMKRLRAIIRPTIGIFTNIGVAHADGFSSKKEKCLEKLSLFTECDLLIYNADNALLVECLREACMGAQEFAWSKIDRSQPLYIDRIHKGKESTKIAYLMLGARQEVEIPFTDESSLENAIHCLAVMLYFGYTASEISERMARLESVPMRLEVKEGRSGTLLVNDSYNHDLNSLETAIDFMNRRTTGTAQRKTVLLSDLHQSGMLPMALYRQVNKLLQQSGITRLVGIGKEISSFSQIFHLDKSFYRTTQEFLASGECGRFSDEVILLKGRGSFHFEEILDLLELKRHETILEVDLGAVVHNLNHYRSKLHPTTRVVAMVKAFGYGAGSFELAKTLQEHRCDYLAVAVADEGVALRKAGITMPIIVMNPEKSSLHTLINYQLEPEVYNFRVLGELKQVADRYSNTEYPIHLKFDTGMNRLGFLESDLDELLPMLEQQRTLRVKSIFSHLAGSDDSALDSFTHQQIDCFNRLSSRVEEVCDHKVLRHILNTGGVERFPEEQMDMVRLGIGLYGIPAHKGETGLQNVMTLKSTILQIKEVAADQTVGYGRRGQLTRTSRIATIPIGYADGLDRRLGNGVGALFLRGAAAPIVGNVCMDLCMIDVTDIPEATEGDEVQLFGSEQSICSLAEQLDTIPYEVVTSISDRVKRVYFL